MTYGFIGLGNMASAILRGMKKSGKFDGDTLCGYDVSAEKCSQLADEIGLQVSSSEAETVRVSDTVVLAVKPQMMAEVLEKIKDSVGGKLILTIAAGKTFSFYESILGRVPLVRIMPNINAKVCSAVSGICGNAYATRENIAVAKGVFETVGTVCEITEGQFPAFSALGGASGAFVLTMIDAIASAGVKAGLPRALSEDVAKQVVIGSGKLAVESGEHPCALVDKICSPGGTTIEGVHALKKYGFETAIHEGIDAIIEKDLKLGK